VFNAGKTRMIGLPYGEKNCDDMVSRFHLIPEPNGQMDRRTDRFPISILRIGMLTRDKNGCSDHYKTLRLDDQWLSDRSNRARLLSYKHR